MQPNQPIKPRLKPTRITLFRVPEDLSDEVYVSFNSYVHRAKVIEGSPAFACRIVRRESLTREELVEIEGLINSEGPDSATARILGGESTLAWIESALKW